MKGGKDINKLNICLCVCVYVTCCMVKSIQKHDSAVLTSFAVSALEAIRTPAGVLILTQRAAQSAVSARPAIARVFLHDTCKAANDL